jgi:thiol-disulfide isomerase/thioredoxin
MKYFLMSVLVIGLGAVSTVCAQNESLKFFPEKPRPGDQVQIVYTTPSNVFLETDTIQCTAYKWGVYEDEMMISRGINYKTANILLVKQGNSFTAKIPTEKSTRGLSFIFATSDLEVKVTPQKAHVVSGRLDTNDGLGYFISFYDSKGDELDFTNYFHAKSLTSFYYATSFGNNKLARKFLFRELELYPANYAAVVFELLHDYTSDEKTEFEENVKLQIGRLFAKGSFTEFDYRLLNRLFYYIKLPETGEYFQNLGEGLYKEKDGYYNLFQKFENESDFATKYNFYQQLKERFAKIDYSNKLNFIFDPAAPGFIPFNLLQYILSKGDFPSYTAYCEKFGYTKQTAVMYPSLAINELKIIRDSLKNEILYETRIQEYLNFINEQYLAAISNRYTATASDEYITDKDKKGNMQFLLAELNLLLADLNMARKEDKKAFQYIKAAKDIIPAMSRPYYEAPRVYDEYCLLAEKNIPPSEVMKEIEQILAKGIWTDYMITVLKTAYSKEKGSDAGFDDYVNSLKKTNMEEAKRKVIATQVNIPAPDFNLVDLDGNTVSLSSLKGKIVVLDFWATWCGPCKASFPGMKKLQEHCNRKGDVKLLFVDTFEKFKTPEENYAAVKKILTQNDYPFQVLFDTKSKVSEDYKVSSIPTKIVIDKNGYIRYEMFGSGPNEGKLIDEMEIMIESIK